jgi:hypothetical protein
MSGKVQELFIERTICSLPGADPDTLLLVVVGFESKSKRMEIEEWLKARFKQYRSKIVFENKWSVR